VRVCLSLAIAAGLALFAQIPRPPDEPRLPDGRSQREEILKSEHAKSLDDADELIKLSEELKIDLEKNDRHIVSVKTLRKLDDIEKLAKRIRGRLKRY
jgi:hypothetical protein